MGKLTETEHYLLEQIRQGNDSAWSQFVQRYQGRLLAFARGKLPQSSDADDLIQETFVSFIRSMGAFCGDCSIESYLFTILRRKVIDYFRQRERGKTSTVQNRYPKESFGEGSDYFEGVASDEPTASWYIRKDESKARMMEVFSSALLKVMDGIKDSLNFDHLKIVEMLFFYQMSNSEAAAAIGIDAARIGLIKHRCIRQIQGYLQGCSFADVPEDEFEGIVASVWHRNRPSCPKRNTIGAYVLGTLEPEWRDYVQFHLEVLGCEYCKANYEDMKQENVRKDNDKICRKIMESTVGFLKR